jgi:hypothetical protein
MTKMTNREILAEMEGEYLVADGFDDAIIGTVDDIVIYSKTKCIEILKQDFTMTEEDALEYYYFNVVGAYVGEKTPMFVEDDLFF